MNYLRWLLLPFSLLYGLVVIVRNWCYDSGLFKSYKFTKPVISIGNLDVGGAGKSPMTEYMVRLLKNDYKTATLSRGYGRKTTGYLVAEGRTGGENGTNFLNALTHHGLSDIGAQIGDEPAQFKQKFPDITVAVCGDRVEGLKRLMPDHDVVILDDAYQHRAVEPGLSILLFDYHRVNKPRLLLPAGNMREPFIGRRRAQVVVVTKCPTRLTGDEKERLTRRIKPLPYQRIFFSSITYQQPVMVTGNQAAAIIDGETNVFLLTGIANATPLVKYLQCLTTGVIHHKYPDHHRFTPKNIAKLAADYQACKAQKKLIVTTEKDSQRLNLQWFAEQNIPVSVIPIKVEFPEESGKQFDQIIIDYVRKHTTYNSIH